MRTDRQILGDLGEAFVAKELRETGFEVKLIGGNFPGYDILASRLSVGTDIRIQVKTWGEGINDKPLAKTHRLHLADVYVLVRGDDLSNLEPYVFLADEIAEARQISEIPPDFPFTRDPGTKNPAGVGYWARKHWLFCHPDRLNAWHLVRPCPMVPVAATPAKRQLSCAAKPRTTTRPSQAIHEREVRNGVRAPKPGGLCDKAWCVCGDLHLRLQRVPQRAEAIAHGTSLGLNAGNLGIEYGYWKKFHGLAT